MEKLPEKRREHAEIFDAFENVIAAFPAARNPFREFLAPERALH
jgi:hypothetical protein